MHLRAVPEIKGTREREIETSDFFDILINFLQSFTPMPLRRSDNEESIKGFPFDVRRSATLRQRDERPAGDRVNHANSAPRYFLIDSH